MSSARQALRNAAAIRSASVTPSPRERARERGDEIRRENCGDGHCGDLLQPGPGRHAVDLEHRGPLVAVVEDVDAGDIGADRGGGAHRERLGIVVRHHRHGPAAALDVGDPFGRMAHHRRDHAAARHQQAKVVKAVTLDADELLQIVDPGGLAGRRQLVRRADQPQAAALRAEQRLEHQRPARRLARDDRARGVAILHRPGRRRRNAGLRQQKARHRLVDAALDRAGVVPHHDAELAQRMQDAEPHRHRFEAAARDGANEHRVGQPDAEAVEIETRCAGGGERAGLEPHGDRRHAQGSQRLCQLAGMPVVAIDHDADARSAGLARKRISRRRHRACPH